MNYSFSLDKQMDSDNTVAFVLAVLAMCHNRGRRTSGTGTVKLHSERDVIPDDRKPDYVRYRHIRVPIPYNTAYYHRVFHSVDPLPLSPSEP
jgi:hypothetical protein